jgi:hypothetical protein
VQQRALHELADGGIVEPRVVLGAQFRASGSSVGEPDPFGPQAELRFDKVELRGDETRFRAELAIRVNFLERVED